MTAPDSVLHWREAAVSGLRRVEAAAGDPAATGLRAGHTRASACAIRAWSLPPAQLRPIYKARR